MIRLSILIYQKKRRRVQPRHSGPQNHHHNVARPMIRVRNILKQKAALNSKFQTLPAPVKENIMQSNYIFIFFFSNKYPYIAEVNKIIE